MDRDTADRVNAVARDVMSAFRHTVELYGHTPELIKAAGFESFEDWARAQPKPQITRGERREMALALQAVGLTQRETAAALGVSHQTVGRELGPTGPAEAAIDEPGAPEIGPTGPAIAFEPVPRSIVPAGYRELMAALKAVAALDGAVESVVAGMTEGQHKRLRVMARRALRVARVLDLDIVHMAQGE